MAANDIYVERLARWGTWDSATNMADIQDLTFQEIARGARVAAQVGGTAEQGQGPPLIIVQGHFEFATAPVIDENVQVWLAAYGPNNDEPPNSLIASTAAQRTNLNELFGCKFAGQGRVATVVAADNVGFTATLEWPYPHIQPLVFNNSAADNLVNTASLSWVRIWHAIMRRQTS